MTLKQAQKQYHDAVMITCKHVPNCIKSEDLQKIAKGCGGANVTVIYMRIGKTQSRVIYTKTSNEQREPK